MTRERHEPPALGRAAVPRSGDLAEALDGLLGELGAWVGACRGRHAGAAPTDGHDQLTYAASWGPWLRRGADDGTLGFLRDARDAARAHVTARGLWRHGYWKRMNVHHGAEHAGIFLDFLVEIDPAGPYRFASNAVTLAGGEGLPRAENLLASGAVQALVELGTEPGGDPLLLRAAERLLAVLATQLADPDAGAAADAVRHYRRATGSSLFDRAVLDAVAGLDPGSVGEVAVLPPPEGQGWERGVGKRPDAPRWLEDGRPRRHSPILLSLAAEIAGDRELAARAVDLARACFRIASAHFPDGREHGCAAGTVSAVARGHGRDNGAGVITAVLEPLAAWDRGAAPPA